MLALPRRGDYRAADRRHRCVFNARPREQMNAALHYSVTCAEDVPRIDAEDAREVARAACATKRLARAGDRACATCGRGAALPADFDAAGAQRRAGAAALRRARPGDAAGVRRRGRRRRCPTAGTSSRAGYGHIVSPHACVPRLIAAFVDERAASTRCRRAASSTSRRARAPPLWSDRLAPRP